jgi:3-hydroxyacyl-CoA dehydrogenase
MSTTTTTTPISTTHYTTIPLPADKNKLIAILTMDSPPVNSLSRGTRAGLVAGVSKALQDKKVVGIIVRGHGRAFSGGAEITEFAGGNGGNIKDEPLTQTIDRLEQCPIPVVSVIHGFALGGGMEVTLGCHYRIVTQDAFFGLPEVNIGLLPGAGGTQRLPRLIGAVPAAEVILSGAHIKADKALKLGICDVVIPIKNPTEEQRLGEAIKFISTKLGSTRPIRKLSIPDSQDPEIMKKLDATLKSAQAKRRGEIAPAHIIACVKAAIVCKTFDEGMKEEGRLFSQLLASPEARALQHVFFAERAVQKLPKEFQAPPADIKSVGIVGAGLMGGGIAMSCVEAGLPVILLDVKQEFLDNGMKLIRTNYDKSVERKSISPQQRDKYLSLLTPTLDYGSFKNCDIVVEAVYEDMKLKKEIFTRLDSVCKPGCILATNTSGLNVDEIAAATKRPQDVVGCHFFSPANVMRLLENVRGAKSSPRAISTAMEFGKRINKVAALVGNCNGFVGNRMLASYQRESGKLALEGASVQRIDQVIEKVLGFNMGPFRMADLVGLELFHRKRKSEGKANAQFNVEDALCEAKRFGMRSGAGFYKYTDGRTAIPDPFTEELLVKIANNLNIRRRSEKITDQEIIERCLYPLINEGYKCLDEGIASKASDIDMIYVFGYGFPRWRGGPMKMVDEIGADVILAVLQNYRRVGGHKEEYFIPAKGLIEAARKVQDKYAKM